MVLNPKKGKNNKVENSAKIITLTKNFRSEFDHLLYQFNTIIINTASSISSLILN